jgi:excisionase family DNA binding protein
VLNGTNKGTPLIDEIACDPKLAHNLALGAVAALLGLAHVAVAALEARLLVLSVEREAPAPVDRESPRLMKAEEVAERLGFKLAYVYELARAGKIKSLQEGKYIRFTEIALSEYIASNAGAVDSRVSLMLSIKHDSQTVQRCARRPRPHANGNGAAPGRASDNA